MTPHVSIEALTTRSLPKDGAVPSMGEDDDFARLVEGADLEIQAKDEAPNLFLEENPELTDQVRRADGAADDAQSSPESEIAVSKSAPASSGVPEAVSSDSKIEGNQAEATAELTNPSQIQRTNGVIPGDVANQQPPAQGLESSKTEPSTKAATAVLSPGSAAVTLASEPVGTTKHHPTEAIQQHAAPNAAGNEASQSAPLSPMLQGTNDKATASILNSARDAAKPAQSGSQQPQQQAYPSLPAQGAPQIGDPRMTSQGNSTLQAQAQPQPVSVLAAQPTTATALAGDLAAHAPVGESKPDRMSERAPRTQAQGRNPMPQATGISALPVNTAQQQPVLSGMIGKNEALRGLTSQEALQDLDVAPLVLQQHSSSPTGQIAQIGSRALPQPVAHQMAVAIAKSEGRETEIRLNPAELGKVRISLSTNDVGVTMTIIAERPETADLMRRNLDSLAQEFRDLGYSEFAFSFSEDGSTNDGDGSEFGNAPDTVLSEMGEGAQQPTTQVVSLTALDLKL